MAYLGARAAIEFKTRVSIILYQGYKKDPEIYYVGNNISSSYMNHLVDVIGDRDFQ